MAISAGSRRKSFGRRHALWAVAAVLVLALCLLAAAVLEWSGASLTSDPVALAHLKSQPLAGSIESAQAFDSSGKAIPLSIHGGRLTPRTRLSPGERVSVNVVVRRPGWLSWTLGKTRHETLTLHAPVAHVTERWLTVAPGSPLRVSFDRAVSAVAYGEPAKLQHRRLAIPRSSVDLGAQPAAGTFTVAAAARPWERLGHPQDVSWFPPARSPVAVSDPAPGTRITPSTQLRLTFSRPVDRVLGSARPKLSPAVAGSWHRPDSHTLLFTPSGFGAPFGTTLHVTLPKAVSLRAPDGGSAKNTQTIDWSVPGGSTLRLHQLLAEAGYLTIEVNNTDAEGRLILADALCYAVEQGAERLVDIATLTGAIVIALGSTYCGLFSNDDDWYSQVEAAGAATGEPGWRLPLHPEYFDLTKGTYADLQNSSEQRKASSAYAAEFLRQFVDDRPWVHMDIAGTAWAAAKSWAGNGATGFGTRTFIELAKSVASS